MKRIGAGILFLSIAGILFVIVNRLYHKIHNPSLVADSRLTPFMHSRESYERPRLKDVLRSAFPSFNQLSGDVPTPNWFAMLHFERGAFPDLSSPPRIPSVSLISLEYTWAPIVYLDAGDRIYRMWLMGVYTSDTVERVASVHFANGHTLRVEMSPFEWDFYSRDPKSKVFYSDRWKNGRFLFLPNPGNMVRQIPWDQLVWVRISPVSASNQEPAITWVFPDDIHQVVHYRVRFNAQQRIQEVIIGFTRNHSKRYRLGVCIQDKRLLMSLREGESKQLWGVRFEIYVPSLSKDNTPSLSLPSR
ncbi:MAG: hypothetical protein KatS3mg016_0507 [Fimbriimonadales bacterium]|nr:MAG: hypothetical protein KatS3mg016_0507 [Fimbriimonadales bacterium]